MNYEKQLAKAMEIIDDYLNAGFKAERTAAHIKARKLYKRYWRKEYKNRIDR